MDKETMVFLTLLVALIWGSLVLVERKCYIRYEDFENRWSVMGGCQIKPDGKWIPAESYYFKEE